MIYKDSHIHIGDSITIKKILGNTIYKGKYKLYSSIKYETLTQQKEYLENLNNFFAIPIIFKEINVEKENQYIVSFCDGINKGIPVYLISNNKQFKDTFIASIMKEHFLLHNAAEYKYRTLFYEYLNNKYGFLILHCKDNIRIDYIKLLRRNFQHMNIIIAHLGRNTIESQQDIELILNQFKYDDNIYFDISTINSINTILTSIKIVGATRILYGSDFPYSFNIKEEEKRRNMIEKALINNYDALKKISGDNFEEIKSRVLKK